MWIFWSTATWPRALCANRNRNEKRKKSLRFVKPKMVFTIAESPELSISLAAAWVGGTSKAAPQELKGVKSVLHRQAKQSCLGGIRPLSPASLEVSLASLPIRSQKSFRSCDESI